VKYKLHTREWLVYYYHSWYITIIVCILSRLLCPLI
jgi:hypothetical protein